MKEATCHIHGFLRDAGYVVTNAQIDVVEAKDVWDDLQRWYQQNEWMNQDKFLDWKFIETKDGDEPVRAARLLPKRLKQLYPDTRSKRATGSDRRVLIHGISRSAAKHQKSAAKDYVF